MDRRRFEHLFIELSVSLGHLVPRYALWVYMREVGLDPDRLSRGEATRFCLLHLSGFLSAQALELRPRPRRRFERAVARFDPTHPTPYEHMARFGGLEEDRP